MKKHLIFFLVFACLSPVSFGGKEGSALANGDRNYPKPQRGDKLLFYVQRTHNRNTIIYEMNLDADGKPDIKEPLHPSWIRYEEGGARKELTFIQKRVYGLDVRYLDKDTWLMHFRSYKKRDIYLMRSSKNNSYRVMIMINGKMAELTSLFICSVTNSLGIPSTVKYIDIQGIDPVSGAIVNENVIP